MRIMQIKKPRMSLSEAHKWHKEHGKLCMVPKFEGHINATLRDAKTGQIVQQHGQKNLSTHYLQNHWVNFNITYSTLYIVISNYDDTMHVKSNIIRSTYQDSMAQQDAASIDYTNKIWTFQTTFLAPNSDRTVNWIGLSYYGESESGSGKRSVSGVICGINLSTPIVQTTINTLEIVYRLVFVRP